MKTNSPTAMPPAWQIAYSRFDVGYGAPPDLSDPEDAITFVQMVQEVMEEERDTKIDNALVEKIAALVAAKIEEGMTERILQRIDNEGAETVDEILKEMGPGGRFNLKERLRED